MARMFNDCYRQRKADSRFAQAESHFYEPYGSLVRNTHTGYISPVQSNFLQKAQAAFERSRSRRYSTYPTKEVPVSAFVDGVKSAFAGIKESSEMYDSDYLDYLWRLRRQEAYRSNPAAYQENSRFSNSRY